MIGVCQLSFSPKEGDGFNVNQLVPLKPQHNLISHQHGSLFKTLAGFCQVDDLRFRPSRRSGGDQLGGFLHPHASLEGQRVIPGGEKGPLGHRLQIKGPDRLSIDKIDSSPKAKIMPGLQADLAAFDLNDGDIKSIRTS